MTRDAAALRAWMKRTPLDATPWQQAVAEAVLTGRGTVTIQRAHRVGLVAVAQPVEEWERVENDPVRRAVRDFLVRQETTRTRTS